MLDFAPMILAQRNTLTVRLAETAADVKAAQRLRFCIFYEEMAARPDATMRASRLDADRFDSFCDHLLVIEQAATDAPEGTRVADGHVVGTYRLLRQDVAEANGGFYTQDEFDIAPLLARHRNLRFLEVGRSCVSAGYRGKPVAELLWQGIWNYVRAHRLDVMLGCASLEGTDADALADELTLLAHVSPAPPEWRVAALPGRRVDMARKELGAVDQKTALKNLPTLVKAYLRLGCYLGEGAVTDHQFNTTDVLIVLPVSAINPKYFSHYGAPDAAPQTAA